MARRRNIFNVNVDLGRRRREEEAEERAVRSEAAERAHRVRRGIVGEEVEAGTFRAEQPQQPDTFGQAAVNMPRSQEGKMAEQLLPGSSGLLERQAKRNAEKIEARKSQVAHDQVITNVNTVDKLVTIWMKVMKSESPPQVKKAMTDQVNLSFSKILGAKGLKFEYTDDWGTGKEKYHDTLRKGFIGKSKLFIDAAPEITSERILTQKYKELIDSAANYKRITKDDPSGTMDLVKKLFTEAKTRIRKPAMDKIAENKRKKSDRNKLTNQKELAKYKSELPSKTPATTPGASAADIKKVSDAEEKILNNMDKSASRGPAHLFNRLSTSPYMYIWQDGEMRRVDLPISKGAQVTAADVSHTAKTHKVKIEDVLRKLGVMEYAKDKLQ